MEMPSTISTRLQYQHKSLVDIIDGLSDQDIRFKLIKDKWSIFETIVHLQSYQHTFINRVRQILTIENPVFEKYIADTDPLFLESCAKTTREIMHNMITVRKEMAAEMSSFSADDLSKKGTHPTYGKLSLLNWINFFLLHEAHHFFVIFKMAAQLRNK